jgi:hypothetical protein
MSDEQKIKEEAAAERVKVASVYRYPWEHEVYKAFEQPTLQFINDAGRCADIALAALAERDVRDEREIEVPEFVKEMKANGVRFFAKERAVMFIKDGQISTFLLLGSVDHHIAEPNELAELFVKVLNQ